MMQNWQEGTIAKARKWITEATPMVVEDIKWRKPSNPSGVPVWSHNGIICTGEIYKDKVKFTFMKGSSLADKTNLFNTGNGTRRAIDVYEEEELGENEFKKLIRLAVELNSTK